MRYDMPSEKALPLPPRNDKYLEGLWVGESGANFTTGDVGVDFFTGPIDKAVRFRYVWFKGVRFMVVSSRNQSADRWEKRAYLSYTKNIESGPVVYGPVVVIGCDQDGRMRSLTELEKDILWDCLRVMSVNTGSKEEPKVSLVIRLCFAEDHPTRDNPFGIEGLEEDVIPDDEAVLGPV